MSLLSKLLKLISGSKPEAEMLEVSSRDEFVEGQKALGDEKKQLFRKWAIEASSLLDEYKVEATTGGLKCYDEAFKCWHEKGDIKEERDYVISYLGGYLGEKLIRDFDMEWVEIRDQYGEAFGVRHSELEVISFPFDAVIKRIDSGEYGFLEAIYIGLRARLEEGGIKIR